MLRAVDLLGGATSVLRWGIAFGHVTVALLLGALAFVWLGGRSGRRSRRSHAGRLMFEPELRTGPPVSADDGLRHRPRAPGRGASAGAPADSEVDGSRLI